MFNRQSEVQSKKHENEMNRKQGERKKRVVKIVRGRKHNVGAPSVRFFRGSISGEYQSDDGDEPQCGRSKRGGKLGKFLSSRLRRE